MFGWASQTLRNLVVTSFGMKSALWSAADPVRLWREAAQEPAANEGQEELHHSLASQRHSLAVSLLGIRDAMRPSRLARVIDSVGARRKIPTGRLRSTGDSSVLEKSPRLGPYRPTGLLSTPRSIPAPAPPSRSVSRLDKPPTRF
jgi:hypothetical protein